MYHYPHNSAIISFWRCCYLYTTHATHLEDNYPDAEGTIAEVATTLSVLYGVLLLPVLVLYRSLELDASNGSSHQPSSPREEELKPPQYHEGDPTQEEFKRPLMPKINNKTRVYNSKHILYDKSLKGL